MTIELSTWARSALGDRRAELEEKARGVYLEMYARSPIGPYIARIGEVVVVHDDPMEAAVQVIREAEVDPPSLGFTDAVTGTD